MLIVLTQPNCPSCENTKRLLQANNIEFREVLASSEEGRAFVKKYNVRSAGTIISEEKGAIVSLSELLEG